MYERVTLEKQLKDLKKSHLLNDILTMVEKMDNMLKYFLMIKEKSEKNYVTITNKYPYCNNNHGFFRTEDFGHEQQFEGDMMIFLSVIEEKENVALAFAAPCYK